MRGLKEQTHLTLLALLPLSLPSSPIPSSSQIAMKTIGIVGDDRAIARLHDSIDDDKDGLVDMTELESHGEYMITYVIRITV